jgi:hypothetical protein
MIKLGVKRLTNEIVTERPLVHPHYACMLADGIRAGIAAAETIGAAWGGRGVEI